MAWADSDAEPTEADWAQVETTHVFVPLGFEAQTGAFGPRTRTFLREVVEVADATSSADLYHWCAMVWGEHWEQRLGVKLAPTRPRRRERTRRGARGERRRPSGLRPIASQASTSKGGLASPTITRAKKE